ncbi:MAG: riboflavin synthase [Gammaproteobacteria bacterium]|nr:riboflavin synthase [Gammaproteobacteria bacterium]
MFTGIIQTLGRVIDQQPVGGDLRIEIDATGLDLSTSALGDSIAVNGVCLTAIEINGDVFAADVSNETLSLTSLGDLAVGSPVNLEKALTPSTPLGGHLVSGHVDGLGKVVRRYPEGRSERFEFEVPANLARYIAVKGSVCIDGVSLTVNHVDGNVFDVNIVPHTQERTIIAAYEAGREVNIEVDVIARYLERLLTAGEPSDNLMERLKSSGFLG